VEIRKRSREETIDSATIGGTLFWPGPTGRQTEAGRLQMGGVNGASERDDLQVRKKRLREAARKVLLGLNRITCRETGNR